ncbi:MAG: methyltransferase domain-containing protein [Vicinamibacterales bacterium]
MSGRRRDRDAVDIAGDYQARALDSPRAAQRFWHRAKIRLLDRIASAEPTDRIADAGCGSGVIAAHLAHRAAEVVGFDSNPAAVSFAAAHWQRPNLRFVLGPFEAMVPEGPFDRICCLEVIEHLYEEQVIEALRIFATAARPGATLFLTTPNARSAWPAIEWTLDRLGLVPTLDEAQHLTWFTRRRLASACEAAGWRVDDLGTFNGLAPFLAVVGDSVGLAAERLEFRTRRLLPWNLIYCLARRT